MALLPKLLAISKAKAQDIDGLEEMAARLERGAGIRERADELNAG